MIVELFHVTLEKEMAAHSSILAWEIPWTEEPGRSQSMGPQRVGHNLATKPSPPPFDVNINNIFLWKIFFFFFFNVVTNLIENMAHIF